MSTTADRQAALTEPAATVAASVAGHVGRFAVLELLGHGGMGLVLAAYDPDLDRRVAIKLLLRGYDGERERLVAEARAMAKLVHPNVITVHEIGDVDGQPFIAMEYAAGGTLRAWLQNSRPWREVLARFVAAGRGLAAAHAAGIVHRDFKPENVLLTKDDEVRVADFGLAALTEKPGVGGTPAYMAPEQRGGATVGPAADQYAFCVALWEALFGARPDDDGAPPPSSPAAWVAPILRRGLRAEPSERWPTMTALLAKLAHDPRAARRRWLLAAAIVGGAVAASAIAVAVIGRDPPRDTRCEGFAQRLAGVWDPVRAAAVRTAFVRDPDTFRRVAGALDAYTGDWVAARTDACQATHARGDQSAELLDLRMACFERRLGEVDALVGLLAKPASPDVITRAVEATARLTPVASCADVAALTAVLPPSRDPAVEALFREVATAVALERTGQFRVGLPLAREVTAAAERTGYAPLIAEALWIRALLEERNNDAKGAQATAEAGLLAAADARDDYLAVKLCSDIVFYVGDRQSRQDDSLFNRCDTALRRAGRPPELEARLSNSYGLMYTAQGKLKEAREKLEHALALWERVRGPDHFETGTAVNNLANVYHYEKRFDDARRLLERASQIREKNLGPWHPDVASSLHNLANEHLGLGNLADAQRLHERSLAIYEKAVGPIHADIAFGMSNLSAVLIAQGNYDQARERLRRAVEIGEHALGPDHWEVAYHRANLGEALWYLDDLVAARRELERAHQILLARGDADADRMRFVLVRFGRVALAQRELAEAERHFARMIAIFEKMGRTSDPELADPLAGLAEVRLAQRDPAAALPLAQRAVELSAAFTPRERAYQQLVLARALVTRDRPRALALAREAREALVAAGAGGAKRLGELDAWLRGVE